MEIELKQAPTLESLIGIPASKQIVPVINAFFFDNIEDHEAETNLGALEKKIVVTPAAVTRPDL
jgi:hypothetical protein